MLLLCVRYHGAAGRNLGVGTRSENNNYNTHFNKLYKQCPKQMLIVDEYVIVVCPVSRICEVLPEPMICHQQSRSINGHDDASNDKNNQDRNGPDQLSVDSFLCHWSELGCWHTIWKPQRHCFIVMIILCPSTSRMAMSNRCRQIMPS